jgi:hypothetical protein
MHFFYLLMFVKLVLLITFFCSFFNNFFNGFKISVKFCVFLYLFHFSKFVFCHFSTFENFEAKRAKNGPKNHKTNFVYMFNI